MKNVVGFISVFILAILVMAPVQANADDSFCVKFDPSIGIGYAHVPGKTTYNMRAHNAGIGGVLRRKLEYDYSGLYLEAALPMTMWDRLQVTLLGSWALALDEEDGRADDYAGGLLGGRSWEVDTDWVTADLNVSYAFVKDVLFIKSFGPVLGFRYDYWKTEYDNPYDTSAGFAAADDSDEAEFKQRTYFPYLGVKTTLGIPTMALSGGKLHIGGDLKLSAIYGPRVWGDVKHEEDRNGGISTRHDTFKGNLESEDSYFYEIFAEYTFLSYKFTDCVSGSMSLFAKYNQMNTEAELDGERTGTSSAEDDFSFEMDRPMAVFGGKVALHF